MWYEKEILEQDGGSRAPGWKRIGAKCSWQHLTQLGKKKIKFQNYKIMKLEGNGNLKDYIAFTYNVLTCI